jgi:hypothetical protein
MYHIRPYSADRWLIVDEENDALLVGTLRECEDWLDFQENQESRQLAAAQGTHGSGWLHWLWAVISLQRPEHAAPLQQLNEPQLPDHRRAS